MKTGVWRGRRMEGKSWRFTRLSEERKNNDWQTIGRVWIVIFDGATVHWEKALKKIYPFCLLSHLTGKNLDWHTRTVKIHISIYLYRRDFLHWKKFTAIIIQNIYRQDRNLYTLPSVYKNYSFYAIYRFVLINQCLLYSRWRFSPVSVRIVHVLPVLCGQFSKCRYSYYNTDFMSKELSFYNSHGVHTTFQNDLNKHFWN